MKTEERQFISLTNDLLFKETFGRNVNFLEYLLEVYYNKPIGSLKGKLAVAYESPILKTKYSDKEFRSDLQAVIDNSIFCNIEMYSKFDEFALDKSESYVMRIHSTQLNRGDEYSKLEKVTQINFVDRISKDIKIKLEEKIIQSKSLYSDNFSMDIVRLDIARKIDYTLDNKFIRLLKFICADTKEKRDSIVEGEEMLMEINSWIENYMADEKWWQEHNDNYWNHLRDIAEGEKNKSIEIAKNLLGKLPLQEIADVTKLSIDEISKLKED